MRLFFKFKTKQTAEHKKTATEVKADSLFRKISSELSKDFVRYFEKTYLHGQKHVINENYHIIERLLWILLIIGLMYCTMIIFLSQLNRYQTNPTVVSIRKDFREWNTIFPAVTLCLDEKLDQSAAADYIIKKWNITADDDKYKYYYDFLKLASSATFRSTIRDFWKYENDPAFENINLMSLVTMLLPNIPLETNVHNNDHTVIWEPVITEMGMCYTFNSHFSKYQSLKLWRYLNLGENNSFHDVKLLTCNNLNNKCHLKLKLIDQPGTYYIHSPYELPEITSNAIDYIEENHEFKVEFRTIYMQAGEDVKSLQIHQRRCKYPDEKISSTIPAYSYLLCQMECRNRLSMVFCDCRPYFYIVGDGKPCDVKGMSCVARNLDFLVNLPKNLAKCECMPQCTAINYMLYSTKLTKMNKTEVNSNTRQTLAFFTLKIPKVMLNKVVFFTFNDLVASFGGTGALFLGASFISIIHFVLANLNTVYNVIMLIRNHCRQNKN